MKTNTGLVEFVNECIGRPYIFGTFGQKLTASLLDAKSKQYPKQLGAARLKKAKAQFVGKRSDDCIGLIKNYLWADAADSEPKYNASEDWSADETFKRAAEKGPISEMPEILGLCVRYSGHVGVYVGGGYVIEARGFDYGVVKTALNSRKWSHWYKHPCIKYESATGANTGEIGHNTNDNVSNANNSNDNVSYIVQKGDTLSKIAARFGVRVGSIAELNNIDNVNLIFPGQLLIIRAGNNKASSKYKVNTSVSPLNMRSNPNGVIIGSVPKNAIVEVIDTNNSNWFKCIYNGVTGYCASKYLVKV